MAEIISPYFNDPYKGTVDTSNAALIQDAYKERYRRRQAEEAKKAAAKAASDEAYNTTIGDFGKNKWNLIPVLMDEQDADTRNMLNKIAAKEKAIREAGGIFKLDSDLTADMSAYNTRAKQREALSIAHRAAKDSFESDIANSNFRVSKTEEGKLLDEFDAAGTTPERRKAIQSELQGKNPYILLRGYYNKEKSYLPLESHIAETFKKLPTAITEPRGDLVTEKIKGGRIVTKVSYKPEQKQAMVAAIESDPMFLQMLNDAFPNAQPGDDVSNALAEKYLPYLQPKEIVANPQQPRSGDGLNFDFGKFDDGVPPTLDTPKRPDSGIFYNSNGEKVAYNFPSYSQRSFVTPIKAGLNTNLFTVTGGEDDAVEALMGGKKIANGKATGQSEVLVTGTKVSPIYNSGVKKGDSAIGRSGIQQEDMSKPNMWSVDVLGTGIVQVPVIRDGKTVELPVSVTFPSDAIESGIYDQEQIKKWAFQKNLIDSDKKLVKKLNEEKDRKYGKSGAAKSEPAKTYTNNQVFKSASDIDTKMLVDGNTYTVGGVKRIYKNGKLLLLPK